jgi:hypothetical protein
MVEYYPKNNTRPVIAGFIVFALFLLLNEIIRLVFGVSIPRYIAIPLVIILGTIVLIKMNPRESKRNNLKK